MAERLGLEIHDGSKKKPFEVQSALYAYSSPPERCSLVKHWLNSAFKVRFLLSMEVLFLLSIENNYGDWYTAYYFVWKFFLVLHCSSKRDGTITQAPFFYFSWKVLAGKTGPECRVRRVEVRK